MRGPRLIQLLGPSPIVARNKMQSVNQFAKIRENLTHTSKTRHVKRTQMVVTVRFTIRMFLTFSDW